jgi:transposase
MVWERTCRLYLSDFYAGIEARGEAPGRAATDPRLLIALWLFGAIEGIGNGRKLARLCAEHDAYRWLCGDVSVNFHTLNDFRVAHEQALDALFTQLLAVLMHHQVVEVKRIIQDGTKVRASARAKSFRRRPRLEQLLAEAKAHVETLKAQSDDEAGESARRRAAQERAARERAARERQERLASALKEMKKLEETKAKQRDDKPSRQNAPRASTTDPEARRERVAVLRRPTTYRLPRTRRAGPLSELIAAGAKVNSQILPHQSAEMMFDAKRLSGSLGRIIAPKSIPQWATVLG